MPRRMVAVVAGVALGVALGLLALACIVEPLENPAPLESEVVR